MSSLDTLGSFEPVVFTIGGDNEEHSGDNHNVVSHTKTAEEFCFTVEHSEKSVEETYDIVQSYYRKLRKERERLLAVQAQREKKLAEMQKQKRKMKLVRDQLESIVHLTERRVFLLSEENSKRMKTCSKYQKYKEVLQNIIKQLPVQTQSMKPYDSSLSGQFSPKLEQIIHEPRTLCKNSPT